MKGQLKTYHDAVKTKQQHVSPCSDCPFSRESLRGWLGRMSVTAWLQVVHGEGIIECHTTDKLCAGAAIYRSNVCKVPRDPNAFMLPSDKAKCFASMKEFISHHRRD